MLNNKILLTIGTVNHLYKLFLVGFLSLLANVSVADKCQAWEWICDIKYGIQMAESQGANGIIVSAYAYHLSVPIHWPTGYTDGVSEWVPGVGYSRTFYNHEYDSEYSLFVLGFSDSFYKPELHVGYVYQKYFAIDDSKNWKWGIGYTPFIFVKPSLTYDAPIPLPGGGITTTLRYKDALLMLTYANQLYLNFRIDFY